MSLEKKARKHMTFNAAAGEYMNELEARIEALEQLGQAAIDATDNARKQYGGTLSFQATTRLDKFAALLEGK